MKTFVIGTGMLLSMGLVALLGCGEHNTVVVRERREVAPPPPPPPEREVIVVERRPADVIIVQEAPPPIRVERRPAPPSPDHVWIAGYYSHGPRGYVWVSGHYVRPPHKGATWVPDAWDHRDAKHWEYKPGHWNTEKPLGPGLPDRRDGGRDDGGRDNGGRDDAGHNNAGGHGNGGH